MLFQAVFSGLITGSLYALVAIGFVVIFKTSKAVNFSQGYLITFIMFTAFTLFSLNLPYLLIFIIICVISVLMSLVIFGLVERVSRIEAELSPLMLTLAVGTILIGLVDLIWGPTSRTIPPFITGRFENEIFSFQWEQILTLAISLVTIILLFLFFNKTKYGLAMKAASEQKRATLLMGIPLIQVKSLSWIISGLLCAISGFLIVPMVFLDQSSVMDFVIFSFAAATIGSLSSIFGAIAGGFIIGVGSNLFALYISSDFKTTFVLLLMLIVLSIKPSGIFGNSDIQKV